MGDEAWRRLAAGYEAGRLREDSFDRILEWPAQRAMLGDVRGLSILDIGCGGGAKDRELVEAGAAHVVGIDVSGRFTETPSSRLQFVTGDLSDLDEIEEVKGIRFDRILFLQSLGYARDQVRTLRVARGMLAPDGLILVARSHPLRFAIERAEAAGTPIGREYYASRPYSYPASWDPDIAVTHETPTLSAILTAFLDAGLAIVDVAEPVLTAEMRARYPHKQERLERYLGIMLFMLRAAD